MKGAVLFLGLAVAKGLAPCLLGLGELGLSFGSDFSVLLEQGDYLFGTVLLAVDKPDHQHAQVIHEDNRTAKDRLVADVGRGADYGAYDKCDKDYPALKFEQLCWTQGLYLINKEHDKRYLEEQGRTQQIGHYKGQVRLDAD
jgi:hypothetical protein